MKTHKMNMGLINEALNMKREIDVVFLGDSITEEWNARLLGRVRKDLRGIQQVFSRYFTRAGGGTYNGVALGIAGDQSPHLLWRLKHGELKLNPKVWWVTMGTNDLLSGGCSPEVVLLGILRIVEEIQWAKPDAIIVINGILPTSVPAVKKDKNFLKKAMQELKKKKAKAKVEEKSDEDDEEIPGDPIKINKGKFMRPLTEVKDMGPTIKIINKQLQKFSEKHDYVKYFDVESIFYTKSEKGKDVIDMNLLQGLHPTKEGHAEWAKKIVKKLNDWITVEPPSVSISLPPEPVETEGVNSSAQKDTDGTQEKDGEDGPEE
jgi:lysophospholipase L1-like esterase